MARPTKSEGPGLGRDRDAREIVAVFGTREQALAAVRALHEVSIPADVVEDEGASGSVRQYWEVWKKAGGGIGVAVPRYLLPEARELLDLPEEPDQEAKDGPAALGDDGPSPDERKARSAVVFAVLGCFVLPIVGQVLAGYHLATGKTKGLRLRYERMRRVAWVLVFGFVSLVGASQMLRPPRQGSRDATSEAKLREILETLRRIEARREAERDRSLPVAPEPPPEDEDSEGEGERRDEE